MKIRRIKFIVVGLLTLLWSSSASAQIAVEGFEPLPNQTHEMLNVSTSEVTPHLVPSVGLFGHFVDDALVYRIDDEPFQPVLDDQYKLELMASLGLFGWIDIGFVAPVTVHQTGVDRAPIGVQGEVDDFAFADPRIVLKSKLLPNRIAGFGAALQLTGYLPLGDQPDYHSDDAFRFEPRLIVDWVGPIAVALNASYQIRPERTLRNIGSDDWIRLGGGITIPIAQPLDVIGTVSGGFALADGRDPGDLTVETTGNDFAQPFEVNGALRIHLPADLTVMLGGGAGITDGIGSPDFRLFAGISHQAFVGQGRTSGSSASLRSGGGSGADEEDPTKRDSDSDGVVDADDQCPESAEDVDNFEDEDGCPEPDNDQDGISDFDDRCPTEAGIPEKQGCPFVDKDDDKIDDEEDACVDEPEDFDNFEDDDGCPEPDNDRDGILDADDKCPLEREVINGVDDEDGCPDAGDTKVLVTEDEIQILETVYFDSGKSTIQERSHGLLNQVASVLRANTQITKVRIEGHTDSRGKADKNKTLSQDRAKAVAEFLTKAGIAEGRLVAEGFGELRPVADNRSKSGRALNRRVEFLILEVKEK